MKQRRLKLKKEREGVAKPASGLPWSLVPASGFLVWFVSNWAVLATPYISLRAPGGAVLEKRTAPPGASASRRRESGRLVEGERK